MSALVATFAGLSIIASAGTYSAEVAIRSTFSKMLDEDLESTFFCEEEFAVSVPYSHKNGPATTYSALFDNPSASAGLLSDVETLAWRPQLRIIESKLKAPPAKGDQVVVKGCRYRVTEYTSDGVGTMLIFLERS